MQPPLCISQQHSAGQDRNDIVTAFIDDPNLGRRTLVSTPLITQVPVGLHREVQRLWIGDADHPQLTIPYECCCQIPHVTGGGHLDPVNECRNHTRGFLRPLFSTSISRRRVCFFCSELLPTPERAAIMRGSSRTDCPCPPDPNFAMARVQSTEL